MTLAFLCLAYYMLGMLTAMCCKKLHKPEQPGPYDSEAYAICGVLWPLFWVLAVCIGLWGCNQAIFTYIYKRWWN